MGHDAAREGAQLGGDGVSEVGSLHVVGLDHFHSLVGILAVLLSRQNWVTFIVHNFNGDSHFDLGGVGAPYLE